MAEKHIAVFWAGWKQQLQLTQRANAQKRQDEKSSKSKMGTLSAIPAVAVSSSGTPASTELAGKHNYAETVGSGGAGSVPKSKVHILWVHSSLVEKGEISEGYFNQVISRCNQIKIRGVLNGEAEHDWSPSMHGQPTYDKTNSRGKIVCLYQQTIDHWVKWIPIASIQVGAIPCKAWTKLIRYVSDPKKLM